MKRVILIVVLLSLAYMLAAKATITKIVVNSDYTVLTRTVIVLSEKTQWSLKNNTAGNTITIFLSNSAEASPDITGLAGNQLISDIKTAPGGKIILTMKCPYYIEKSDMNNPYRIILDIFKAKKYTFLEHYEQAAFYERVGKLASSEKEYRKMLSTFPYSLDTHYFFAKLLVHRGKLKEAIVHYAAVPSTSKFYNDAQIRLARLDGRQPSTVKPEPVKVAEAKPLVQKKQPPKAEPIKKQESKPAQPVTKSAVPLVEDNKKKETPAAIDTALAASEEVSQNESDNKTAQSNVKRKVKSIPPWGWVIIGLVLAGMVYIIIDTTNSYARKARKRHPLARTLTLDQETKKMLVCKRLAQGMTAWQIARDLRMKRAEVNMFIIQCIKDNPKLKGN